MRLFFIILAIFISNAVFCCSCTLLDTMDRVQYNSYDVILKGRITLVLEKGFERIIIVKVETNYKGLAGKATIRVISPAQFGECGIFPKIGEDWLIFAFSKGKYYEQIYAPGQRT